MKKFFLSPFFAPIFALVYICILCAPYIGQSEFAILNFTDFLMEIITFCGYAVTFAIALYFAKDYKTVEKRKSYGLFLFLLIAAVLREAGIQHWIPSKDTTAFKLRFFTNPDNPLNEKLLAAVLLVLVIWTIVYLLVKYLPALIKGFFKMDTLSWTICTFGGTGVVAKFVDRFPSNYVKWTGEHLEPIVKAHFVLFEETSESVLPLLFAVALIQAHFLAKKHQAKAAAELKETVSKADDGLIAEKKTSEKPAKKRKKTRKTKKRRAKKQD